MAAAIWMIIYDLERTHAEQYLQWFDEVHIPEKLARPGYTWAAHYRVVDGDEVADSRYIALFGGADSGVFYNPSPAQIKPRQPPQTRTMMGYRSNSEMLILAEEWVSHGESARSNISPRISADTISLALFNANANDEGLGAWLVQDYLVNSASSGITRKLLASSGTVRHVVVHELAEGENPRDRRVDGCWWHGSEQIPGYLSYPAGDPLIARRVWPDSVTVK